MKTVSGRVISAEPISLSKAATILSGFVSSENEASQDVSAYLRRASAAFGELKSIHREIRSTKSKSEARHAQNPTDELEELGRAKGIDDLVENGGKFRSRDSETVTVEESIHGRKQDEIKENKKRSKEKKEDEIVKEKVTVKLEDKQGKEERKERKEKSKKKKEKNVIDEKVYVKLEEEQRSEESKESENEKKKKKKRKKNKCEDVTDEKLNEKLEEEQRNEEQKEKKKKKKKEKKKRKSDEEIGSEERKSKKKRKSKEIDG